MAISGCTLTTGLFSADMVPEVSAILRIVRSHGVNPAFMRMEPSTHRVAMLSPLPYSAAKSHSAFRQVIAVTQDLGITWTSRTMPAIPATTTVTIVMRMRLPGYMRQAEQGQCGVLGLMTVFASGRMVD